MNNKKSLIALALVALIGIVGGTFAYFTSRATVENEFVTGIYATSVKEEFVSPDNWTPGTTTEKKINVTNNGNVDIAVRATYTEAWIAADGVTVLSGERNGERVAIFEIGEEWEESTDGWYYYNAILSEGEVSSNFIEAVTFNPNFELEEGVDIECTTTKENGVTIIGCTNLETGYGGATYTLEITLETIQADQKWTYETNAPKTYEVGDVITIGEELFNVISDNGDTVTMLAAYNLGTDYRQTTETTYVTFVTFSDVSGWTTGEDIDIQLYDGNAKTYVNNYVSYLQGETGDTSLNGTLITKGELETLGCIFNDSTCVDSKYASWLVNGQVWKTRSAYNSTNVWYCSNTGSLSDESYNMDSAGIRPVITISKTVL